MTGLPGPPGERLIRLALRAHGRAFRARHGEEIIADYATRWSRRGGRGVAARAAFVARAVMGELLAGLSGRGRSDGSVRGDTYTRDTAMSGLRGDAWYAWRALRKRPAFAAVVIVTLALGLGANTAVFGLIDAVVLSPLSYPQPERLVRIYENRKAYADEAGYLTEPAFMHIRENATTIEPAAFYTYDVEGADLTDGDRPERVRVLRVGAGYFDVLRSAPAVGRVFRPDEVRDSAAIVVISDGLWRRYFAGAGDVVGRTLTIDGAAKVVIGVMPAGFEDPGAQDISAWLPMPLRSAGFESWEWDNHWLSSVARLRPGATIASAEAELARLVEQQGRIEPGAEQFTMRLVPLHADVVGQADTMLWVLLAAVGMLLLITCVNVAGLQVAQSSARGQELAVRGALGAPRARLVSQLVLESVMLALIGGVVGLAVAIGLTRVLASLAPAGLLPGGPPTPDARLFVYGLLLSAASGLLAGIWPAIRAARPDIATTLREGARAGERHGAARARAVLVVLQCALALVLLAGAGVLLRSLDHLRSLDLGVRTGNVWTFEVHLPEARYGDGAVRARLYAELNRRLAALPGVRAAGAANYLPATGNFLSWGVRPNERDDADRASFVAANQRIVEGEYFRALGIPVLSGRTFGPEESADAPPRVVISRALAQELFPDQDAVGRFIRVNGPREVIGVVADVALDARGGGEGVVYHAHRQYSSRSWSLAQVIALDGPDARFIERARQVLTDLDPLLVLYSPRKLDDVVGAGTAADRFAALLLTSFAALALVLAALGIYGVLVYIVGRRRREIGIRMALGARAGEVRRMVVRQGMTIAGGGIAIGVVAALIAVRALRSLVFDVDTRDPAAFISAIVVLGLVAFLASWLPARSATRVDPVTVLGRE